MTTENLLKQAVELLERVMWLDNVPYTLQADIHIFLDNDFNNLSNQEVNADLLYGTEKDEKTMDNLSFL